MIKQEQILLHEDNELAEILGLSIVSREQIQAWPLSVVARILLSDNTSRIYKAFYNLPIETEFYRRVQSPHIPKVFYNHSDGDHHWLRADRQVPTGLRNLRAGQRKRRNGTLIG